MKVLVVAKDEKWGCRTVDALFAFGLKAKEMALHFDGEATDPPIGDYIVIMQGGLTPRLKAVVTRRNKVHAVFA